jgi:hypothetical protein
MKRYIVGVTPVATVCTAIALDINLHTFTANSSDLMLMIK